MNPLTALFRKLTYRTGYSTPDQFPGLVVTGRGWGTRTVYDPRVPAYLETRRRRVLRKGLDPIDRALLDPATLELLALTAARMSGVGLLMTEGVIRRRIGTFQVSDADCRRIADYVTRYVTTHADRLTGPPTCGGQPVVLEGHRSWA